MPITYFGGTLVPADNSAQAGPGPTTVTPPASMQAGDLVLVFQQYRATDAAYNFNVSEPGGQDWHKLVEHGTGSLLNVSVGMYACRFNGTWSANPTFSADSTLAHSMWMVVFRPSAITKLMDLDVAPIKGTFVAGTNPFTKTISGITTRHDGAVAIALWASPDDNTWGSLTGGWTNPDGATQLRNTTGSQQSMALAYQVFSTAGATGDVSMNQATLGGDAGGTLVMSFYERDEPTGIPTVDVIADFEDSTDGTLTTATIISNGTHPASPGGTWGDGGAGASNIYVENDGEQNFSSGRKVIAGGVTYDDVGSTRGLRVDHASQGGVGRIWQFTFTAAAPLVSVGHYFKTTMAYGNSTNFSCTINQLVDGGFTGLVALNWDLWRADFFMGLVENAASEVSPFISFHRNTWYWVTMQYDKAANLGKIAFYDPTTWQQVGFTGVFRLYSSAPGDAASMIIGQNGGGLQSQAADTYLDDLIIDYTNGQFPLMPNASSLVTHSSVPGMPMAVKNFSSQNWLGK